MYPNLTIEMKIKQITAIMIGLTLNLHQNSIYNKLNGKSDFTIDEAIRIKNTFFIDCDFEYLFTKKSCA